MKDKSTKPASGSEQSFQYVQDHVARSMANFYAAYRSSKSGSTQAGSADQAKTGGQQAKADKTGN